MANSLHRDVHGPDWPCGLVTVAASGTPKSIMSVVDATFANDPSTTTGMEYSPRTQQIIFDAVKSVAPVVENTGAIYILRAPAAGGTGNKTDSGTVVKILRAGQTFVLNSAPANRDVFSPYRYFIDADNSGDGCIVTLVVS